MTDPVVTSGAPDPAAVAANAAAAANPATPVTPAATPATPAAPVAGETILTNTPATPAVDPAAAKAAEPVKSVVPEVYEFKAPEGVTLNAQALEAFTPLAKELGLSQEQAQKLVDLQVAQTEAAKAQWTGVVKTWGDESRADKEFGGVHFAENVGFASKAIDKFGTPALRKALDDSGMGNHPEVIRFMLKVGKTMSEDTMTSGNAAGGVPTTKTAAQVLFPGMN